MSDYDLPKGARLDDDEKVLYCYQNTNSFFVARVFIYMFLLFVLFNIMDGSILSMIVIFAVSIFLFYIMCCEILNYKRRCICITNQNFITGNNIKTKKEEISYFYTIYAFGYRPVIVFYKNKKFLYFLFVEDDVNFKTAMSAIYDISLNEDFKFDLGSGAYGFAKSYAIRKLIK